ncbi:MAG: aminotransferase class V-fold PLP-dependent enzyme [Chitinophagaceae bacterium]|nr:aminotransferase class V-fold PLP-dependent enzyme [Chitinophagaceae bacterium]
MKNILETVKKDFTLDPQNWDNMRKLGHQMIDDMMNYLENISKEPVWRKIPDEAKYFLDQDIPKQPQEIEEIYDEFKQFILPYNKGNIHPRFFAWVQGTGTPFGMLAEMLAAGMNPNTGIGEHAAMYVDRQVVEWCKQMMNYPKAASGILLSGASMANVTALTVARNHQLKKNVRKEGLKTMTGQMLIYCSTETHSCLQKAAEVLGLGTDAIRKISVDEKYKINISELTQAIEKDMAAGNMPFCIVANAGTVNTGAIDPLDELIAVSKKYNLWLHVDGAFGALAKLVPEYAAPLKGIEQADSVAFDLHKWMYMPYEIGCVLIKNAEAHRNAFSVTPNYLMQEKRGLAGGPDAVNNYGLELSRGFKALKVWMCLKENGLEKYIELIRQNIAQAFYFGELVKMENDLELITPVTMNIVCYRYKKEEYNNEELNNLNKEILIQLQEQGIASPSSTILGNKFAIRLAITNHRTKKSDLELLIKETKKIGNKLSENWQ